LCYSRATDLIFCSITLKLYSIYTPMNFILQQMVFKKKFVRSII
jgi:hypothetical protein